jgi:hypothetical protein
MKLSAGHFKVLGPTGEIMAIIGFINFYVKLSEPFKVFTIHAMSGTVQFSYVVHLSKEATLDPHMGI